MILNFDPERMIPVVFYHYPTCVIDRIAEFEDFADNNSHFAGDKDVKQFFEDCLKYVEEKLDRHLMDNKIAMKVVLPETGQYFYVGYKDNIYCIGLSLNPHMTGDRKFIV